LLDVNDDDRAILLSIAQLAQTQVQLHQRLLELTLVKDLDPQTMWCAVACVALACHATSPAVSLLPFCN
jgi:hypothetical protein